MKGFLRLCARDVMTSPVVAVGVDMPVREAAELLSGHDVSGALVSAGAKSSRKSSGSRPRVRRAASTSSRP